MIMGIDIKINKTPLIRKGILLIKTKILVCYIIIFYNNTKSFVFFNFKKKHDFFEFF